MEEVYASVYTSRSRRESNQIYADEEHYQSVLKDHVPIHARKDSTPIPMTFIDNEKLCVEATT